MSLDQIPWPTKQNGHLWENCGSDGPRNHQAQKLHEISGTYKNYGHDYLRQLQNNIIYNVVFLRNHYTINWKQKNNSTILIAETCHREILWSGEACLPECNRVRIGSILLDSGQVPQHVCCPWWAQEH